jgi:hypothetical protein
MGKHRGTIATTLAILILLALIARDCGLLEPIFSVPPASSDAGQ